MTLQQRVDSDLKDGMRAKDATKVGVLRMLKSALKYAAIEKSPARVLKAKKGAKPVKVPAVLVRSTLDAKVNDIEVTPKRWLAATLLGDGGAAVSGQSIVIDGGTVQV